MVRSAASSRDRHPGRYFHGLRRIRRPARGAGCRTIDPTTIDPAYDYQNESEEGFWFDFIADTGDGWSPTYAVARLLATPQLNVAGSGNPLPRGRLLVMGGDQVYPTASREDYQNKLVAPFDEAARGQQLPPNLLHVYAIPGNHDWYDGLFAFLGLCCRRRRSDDWAVTRPGGMFGGRVTQQTRSYFALALPQGWWLWAADIQLAGYIDQPQIDFFTHVAREGGYYYLADFSGLASSACRHCTRDGSLWRRHTRDVPP